MGMKGDSVIEIPMNKKQISTLKDASKSGSKMKGASTEHETSASAPDEDPPEASDEDGSAESREGDGEAESSEQATLPRPVTFEEFKKTLSPDELAFFADEDDEEDGLPLDDDDVDDEKAKKKGSENVEVRLPEDADDDEGDDDDDDDDDEGSDEKDSDDGFANFMADVEDDAKPEPKIRVAKASSEEVPEKKKNDVAYYEFDYTEPGSSEPPDDKEKRGKEHAEKANSKTVLKTMSLFYQQMMA
ncbi:uncharacterized protein LOC127752337 [Frankliniella occidentalis]|uniref:Uncharacterized protein LOC127752337 n=1 Tax=Frankliniella occidentalis TaxID=133901 RepID=A0A9C6XWP9_FRAOC|nr:uncharacterized protein LOC127752337 [Frankliniella occidentalis]